MKLELPGVVEVPAVVEVLEVLDVPEVVEVEVVVEVMVAPGVEIDDAAPERARPVGGTADAPGLEDVEADDDGAEGTREPEGRAGVDIAGAGEALLLAATATPLVAVRIMRIMRRGTSSRQ